MVSCGGFCYFLPRRIKRHHQSRQQWWSPCDLQSLEAMCLAVVEMCVVRRILEPSRTKWIYLSLKYTAVSFCILMIINVYYTYIKYLWYLVQSCMFLLWGWSLAPLKTTCRSLPSICENFLLNFWVCTWGFTPHAFRKNMLLSLKSFAPSVDLLVGKGCRFRLILATTWLARAARDITWLSLRSYLCFWNVCAKNMAPPKQ